ncbi:RNA 2',3'-cyclic phosphodiesterase [Cupriavidus basilensis]|uniref:RNA 2',3'-cyclic phosphodiesterase n=1 Tax=Cupriavidus basilensis TaxID=68895 RepID=A0A643FU09_9BURK|nr:RNA 2',3'-cyclic phosphodiesterase [Cupriavidus basilensis]QOT80099.1 RNA 2',3'-cyclic phosphodiesterase [Cupriavidus basilensis]
MARLFVAIEVPPALAAALLARVPRVAGIRAAAPHQVHLTLHFLGEQDDATAACIEQALGGVCGAAFALTVKAAGYFRGRRASVLWAGVAPNAALDSLHARMAQALAGCEGTTLPDAGLRQRAGFHPHITLARCGPAVADTALQAWRDAQAGLVCEPFPVARFILYQSHLRAGGAQHVCRRAYGLDPAPG